MGTSPFARTIFQLMLKARCCEIIAVITQPDKPAGRGHKIQTSSVKQWAQEHNLPILQPSNINTEQSIAQLKRLQVDLHIVAAYGQILKPEVIETAKRDCINVHASLLPKWRGAAPVQRAIQMGDTRTGVSIMRVVKGLDSGAVMAMQEVSIAPSDTALTLEQKLAAVGGKLLMHSIEQFDSAQWREQDSNLATYAKKIAPSEAHIGFNRPARELQAMVQAMTPSPGAWLLVGDKRIKLAGASVCNSSAGRIGRVLEWGARLKVQCAQCAISFDYIQFPGKKMTRIQDFYNGQVDLFTVGEIL